MRKCKKVWYYEKWVGRHAYFPPRRSVKIKSNLVKILDIFFSVKIGFDLMLAALSITRKEAPGYKVKLMKPEKILCKKSYMVCTDLHPWYRKCLLDMIELLLCKF